MRRLKLSAHDYGRLVGVTGQTIYSWEQDYSRPRQAQMAKLVAARDLGRREALAQLEMMGVGKGSSSGKGKGWKRPRRAK